MQNYQSRGKFNFDPVGFGFKISFYSLKKIYAGGGDEHMPAHSDIGIEVNPHFNSSCFEVLYLFAKLRSEFEFCSFGPL